MLDIKINGNTIIGKFPIKSIEIKNEINKIPFCTIKIFDYNDTKENLFIDDNVFKIGSKIEIYDKNNSGKQINIFSGLIIKISLKLNKELDENFTEITAYPKIYEMDICKKSNCYLKKTDSEIIKNITSKYSITTEIEQMEIKHDFIYQNDITDWDFIKEITENYGYILSIEDNKIFIGKPKTNNCVLKTSIKNIINSNIEINGNSQISKFNSKTWDVKNQCVKEFNTNNKNKNSFGNIKTEDLTSITNNQEYQILSNSISEDRVKTIIEGINELNEYTKITGYIMVYNELEIKPNRILNLDDYCNIFSGNFYISKVENIYTEENQYWITKIHIGIKKNNTVDTINNNYGITSSIYGLKYGKVLKIEGDEDSNYRIYVHIPTINNDNEGTWCRLASTYASTKGGILFLPEKDDEVIIGFIENNTSSPVVLGSLYNNKNKPNVEFKNDNNTKIIRTNNEMEIRFEEKEKNIIIKSSENRNIKISEEEKKIEIKSDEDNIIIENGKISIKCNNDILINGKNITLNSNGNIKIKSSNDVNIEGVNIKVNGSMSTNIKGGSSSKLESSGITEIKGSLVNIN